MNEKVFAMYIMGNARPTLYVGMTNSLLFRIYEHKKELMSGFTKEYHLHELLYYEIGETPMQAIIREKQVKNMLRKEKLELISNANPGFHDLYSEVLLLYGVSLEDVAKMYDAERDRNQGKGSWASQDDQ